MPTFYARHVYTQAQVDLRMVNVGGTIGCQFPINIRHKTQGCVPTLNNGTDGAGTSYSGMTTPVPNSLRWSVVQDYVTGMVKPANANVITQGFTAFDGSHMPSFAYYPWVVTGRPKYMEQLLLWGNNAIAGGVPSNATALIDIDIYMPVGSTGGRNITTPDAIKHWGVAGSFAQIRDLGWSRRNTTQAAGTMPNPMPGRLANWQYVRDIGRAQTSVLKSMKDAVDASGNTFASTNGLFLAPASSFGGALWNTGYLGYALAMDYALLKDPDTLEVLNANSKWMTYCINTLGGWNAAGGIHNFKEAGDFAEEPLLTSDELLAVGGPLVTWTDGSADFIMTPGGSGSVPYSPTVGDKIMFMAYDTPTHVNLPTPGAFSVLQPRYILSSSDNGNGTFTITLTATKSTQFGGPGGGSPIVNTDSSPWQVEVYFVWASAPAESGYNGPGADSYIATELGMLKYAQHVGGTVDAAAMADYQYRLDEAGVTFNNDPKNAMAV